MKFLLPLPLPIGVRHGNYTIAKGLEPVRYELIPYLFEGGAGYELCILIEDLFLDCFHILRRHIVPLFIQAKVRGKNNTDEIFSFIFMPQTVMVFSASCFATDNDRKIQKNL